MTTRDQLERAMRGEIENRFESGEMLRKPIGFDDLNGMDLIVFRDSTGSLDTAQVETALKLWSHVPTPQPEVIWEHSDRCVRVLATGELQQLWTDKGWEKWETDQWSTEMAAKIASLHSSLKALEQEREQFLKVAKTARAWRDAMDGGVTPLLDCIDIVHNLAALSPYPREEKS